MRSFVAPLRLCVKRSLRGAGIGVVLAGMLLGSGGGAAGRAAATVGPADVLVAGTVLLPIILAPGGKADPVVLAAGDIAGCDSVGDEATAALLDGLGGTVVALGDTAYNTGSAADFANCYAPELGAAHLADQAGGRQPRVRHGGRRRLLRLLWQRGGDARAGLL